MREFVYILGCLAVISYGMFFGLIGLSELWITSQDEEDQEDEKDI
nr:MAG TPA: hypothetical protein [Caudoviricetes sp.]